MEYDKLRMQTPDIMEENFRKLQELFPSAVTETIGEDGKPRRTVDADVLRQLIDADVAEGREERYQFTWPEKAQSVLRACAPTRKTLRLDRSKSVGSNGTAGSIDTENIYIEGDNLEALKILQETYLGKVKMIYIDPPYNTGNDFIYRDDFSEDEEEYWEESGQLDDEGGRLVQNMESSGRFHTNWLNMIYPRLWLARDLLAQDGVIFISIDDNEAHNLRKCCDDIFGAGNFVGQLNWKRSGGRQDSKYYAVIHEYIICYARNRSYFVAGEEVKEDDVYPKYDEKKGRYYKTQLLRKWGANSLREDRPNLYYPIKGPDGDVYPTIYQAEQGGDGFVKIEGCWRHSAANLANMQREGRIEFQKNKFGEWVAYEKIFAPKEGEERTKKYSTWIDDVGNGTSTIKGLFSSIIFDYSKSPELIARFLKMGNVKEGALVLDFFSGSATTAHALLQLNAEDGGKRRFIMIQLPEECAAGSEARKAGFANICEIGEERIRRAGRKIREEMTGKNSALDIGFRVFYVDSSNMKDVWYTPEETAQDQLGSLVDNIKEDRTAEDLLFQAMLELGIELSAPIAEEEIAGHRVFFVRDGALAACFDDNIKEETLTEIAKRQPLFAVLRDSGLADDSAYVNFEQIFKAYSPGTRRRVI